MTTDLQWLYMNVSILTSMMKSLTSRWTLRVGRLEPDEVDKVMHDGCILCYETSRRWSFEVLHICSAITGRSWFVVMMKGGHSRRRSLSPLCLQTSQQGLWQTDGKNVHPVQPGTWETAVNSWRMRTLVATVYGLTGYPQFISEEYRGN